MIIAVTGTNTDVGKTVSTAAIAAVLKRRGFDVVAAKPIQTGEEAGQGMRQPSQSLLALQRSSGGATRNPSHRTSPRGAPGSRPRAWTKSPSGSAASTPPSAWCW